jgi:hypothetical protein
MHSIHPVKNFFLIAFKKDSSMLLLDTLFGFGNPYSVLQTLKIGNLRHLPVFYALKETEKNRKLRLKLIESHIPAQLLTDHIAENSANTLRKSRNSFNSSVRDVLAGESLAHYFLEGVPIERTRLPIPQLGSNIFRSPDICQAIALISGFRKVKL